MKKPLFIAISGKKGSGKDEFAKQLQVALESSMKSMSAPACFVDITHFADPLKEMCIQLFGLDRKLVYGSNADKEKLTTVMWDGFPFRVRCKYSSETTFCQGIRRKVPRSGPMTHRELLQVMGTDIFRERVYNNIWAEYPFKQNWEDTNVVFIADCRFPNEVEETLKNGGHVIRINRNTGFNDNHPSEIALDTYDWTRQNCHVVDNNGSLEDLRQKASECAELISYILKFRHNKEEN